MFCWLPTHPCLHISHNIWRGIAASFRKHILLVHKNAVGIVQFFNNQIRKKDRGKEFHLLCMILSTLFVYKHPFLTMWGSTYQAKEHKTANSIKICAEGENRRHKFKTSVLIKDSSKIRHLIQKDLRKLIFFRFIRWQQIKHHSYTTTGRKHQEQDVKKKKAPGQDSLLISLYKLVNYATTPDFGCVPNLTSKWFQWDTLVQVSGSA